MAAIGFGMRNGMSSITHPRAKSTYGFLTGARIACPGRNSNLGAYRLSPSQIEPMDDLDSLIAATACPGPVSPA